MARLPACRVGQATNPPNRGLKLAESGFKPPTRRFVGAGRRRSQGTGSGSGPVLTLMG